MEQQMQRISLTKTKAKSLPISLTKTKAISPRMTKAKSLPISLTKTKAISPVSDSYKMAIRHLFYKKLLDKYKETPLFGIILNIILMCEEIRPAYLFEPEWYYDEEIAFVYTIPKIFKNIKPIVFRTDKRERMLLFIKDSFVDKSIHEDPTRIDIDRYVGEYLGFNCFDHDDFHNYRETRFEVTLNEKVTDTPYFAEVCEKNKTTIQTLRKSVKAKNNRINELLVPLGYKSAYKVSISPGYLERYEKLKDKDIDYVKKNSFYYTEDLWNCYLKGDRYSTTYIDKSLSRYNFKNVNKENITKLTEIYKISCIDEKFMTLYKDPKITGTISRQLFLHDTEYWNGTRQLQDIGKNLDIK